MVEIKLKFNDQLEARETLDAIEENKRLKKEIRKMEQSMNGAILVFDEFNNGVLAISVEEALLSKNSNGIVPMKIDSNTIISSNFAGKKALFKGTKLL